jgi:hypothetical protein
MEAGGRVTQEQLPRNLLGTERWASFKIPRFDRNDKLCWIVMNSFRYYVGFVRIKSAYIPTTQKGAEMNFSEATH